jgi:glycosyltransferase involved in cell wall biosynthesis
MKVAIIHYAEPVSLDEGFIITRYASLAKCLLKNEIKVTRYFPSFNHRSRKFRKFRSYKDKEYGNHIKIDTPDYYRSRSIKRLIFLRAFKRNLFIKLSKTKYDLYLVGCPMPGIASEIKKRFPQSKVLLDLRDFWPDIQISSATGIKKYIYKILGYIFRRWTINDLKSSDRIVTLSESYAQKIKKICYKPSIPTVIPLGSVNIHSNNQSLLKKNFLKKRGVIFVGSLSDLFDFERLMQVWEIFENKYPKIAESNILTIVGHGSKSKWISNKIKKLKFVKMTNFIPQDEAFNIMSKSRVALILYRKMNFFTLPNKLFEFAAAGLPIISNWSGDVNSLTKNYGFSFGHEDITNDEIILELRNLLINNEHSKRAMLGSVKFSKDYSRTKSSNKFKVLINNLLRN